FAKIVVRSSSRRTSKVASRTVRTVTVRNVLEIEIDDRSERELPGLLARGLPLPLGPELELPDAAEEILDVDCLLGRAHDTCSSIRWVSGLRCAIRSAAFSAIMIVAAFVFARVIVGITDASTTRSPSTPNTRNSESTTAPI